MLLTDQHASSSFQKPACLWSHAGSDNGWTWSCLWESAALLSQTQATDGAKERVYPCVDSGQWTGVDSWVAHCLGTKHSIIMCGLPRVTWPDCIVLKPLLWLQINLCVLGRGNVDRHVPLTQLWNNGQNSILLEVSIALLKNAVQLNPKLKMQVCL